jgi:hypothetical protein
MLDFLRTVLPKDGPFCIAYRNKERKGFFHRVGKDHLAAAKLSAWGAIRGWDVYFCISSLKAPEWVDAAGKPHKRKKENCAKTGVLVLDVDIGASASKYHTKDEALEALTKFTTALDFKPPLIVDSGYGLHVYWLIKNPMDSKKWEILADYFKKIAIVLDPKLTADTTRIADSAGVLRVPGTRNYRKTDDPQGVKLLQFTEDGDTALDISKKLFTKGRELNIAVIRPKAKQLIPAASSKLASDLGLDVPHNIDAIMQKCNWMRRYAVDIKIASESEWYAVLGLLKHCYHPKKTARELAHYFSRGHPGYSEEETDRKFEQVRLAQSGPSMCARFGKIVPERCVGCKFASMVTSPAQLDQVDLPDDRPILIEKPYKDINGHISKFVAEALPMPQPYFRGKSGGIYMNLDGHSVNPNQDDTNTVRKIYEYDILPLARLQNEDTGEEEIEIILYLPKDGQKIIRVPIEYTTEPKRFATYLAARGVLLKQHEILPLINYMIDYIRLIQKTSEARGIYTRFGWRHPQTPDPIFVLGDGVIKADGTFIPGGTANWLQELKQFASATGNITEWRKAFEINLQYSIPAYQFTMMLGFASPLFALTPYSGMMFNILGAGGIGKSTALKFMTSIWGKPTYTHILQKDNSIPVFNKIGYLNSLPVAYDEITNLPADQTADLAYSITEGRGKERADRSGNTKINFIKWSTILVSCSNLSLYEKIGLAKKGNTAPAYRIFEAKIEETVKEENRLKIEEAIRILDSNYGVAGRMFMQYAVSHNTEIIEKLVKEEERISVEFGLKNVERFWGGMFAAVSVSMDICHELGIHSFEKEKVLQWAHKEITSTRGNLVESQGDALSIFTDYLNSNLHATIYVIDGRVTAHGIANTPNKELHIRFEKKNGKFTSGYISSQAFKRYCINNKIEYGWFKEELKQLDMIIAGITSKRLGAGTDFFTSPINCLKLNLESPHFDQSIIQEPTQ